MKGAAYKWHKLLIPKCIISNTSPAASKVSVTDRTRSWFKNTSTTIKKFVLYFSSDAFKSLFFFLSTGI